MNARHARKINSRRLTLVLTALLVSGLVIGALVSSIVSSSSQKAIPHGPQAHARPSTSAPAPTHANPAPSRSAPSPARTAPVTPKHELTPTPSHRLALHYTVKPGDNLSVIAERYHLRSYVPLYDANRHVVGNNPNLIYAGQVLTIPGT